MRQLKIFILLTLFGCSNKQTTGDSNITPIKQVALNKGEKKTIDDYMSDTSYILWTAHHPDTTQYMCEVTFRKEFAIYWYHGQCQYSYFTYKTSDTTIDLLWSYKTDCTLDMSFLERDNGIKSYPKRGDVFATYYLTSDSTIKVRYYFPEWIKKVNTIAGDSVFPINFFLDNNKGT